TPSTQDCRLWTSQPGLRNFLATLKIGKQSLLSCQLYHNDFVIGDGNRVKIAAEQGNCALSAAAGPEFGSQLPKSEGDYTTKE
ncbi:MAG: hypothetical protein WAV18_20865, partial [Roseiarcus sp.]